MKLSYRIDSIDHEKTFYAEIRICGTEHCALEYGVNGAEFVMYPKDTAMLREIGNSFLAAAEALEAKQQAKADAPESSTEAA